MTEQQQIEYHEILKSYEDTIKNLGEDISNKTIDRYCELVMKEYPILEKRHQKEVYHNVDLYERVYD